MNDDEILAKCQSVAVLFGELHTITANVNEKAKAEFEESANKIENKLGQIDNLLDQFSTNYVEIQNKIDEAESDLNGKFDALKSDIEISIVENIELFKTTEARLQITERISEAGTEKIDEINELLDQQVNALKQSALEHFESAEEFIVSNCDEMDDVVQVLTGFIEDSKSIVTDELDNAIQAFEEQVQTPVSQLTSNIEKSFEFLLEFIGEEIVNGCSLKLKDKIIQPLEQEIEEVVESIQTYLAQFVSDVISGSEESKQSKQEMEASTQIIEEAISPVLDALDRVKGLAGTVGISL